MSTSINASSLYGNYGGMKIKRWLDCYPTSFLIKQNHAKQNYHFIICLNTILDDNVHSECSGGTTTMRHTQKEFLINAHKILDIVFEKSRNGQMATLKDIGYALGISPNTLSPSANSFKKDIFCTLLQEGLIAKVKGSNDNDYKTIYIKPMRSREECDAFITSYRFDKRKINTIEKDVPYTVIKKDVPVIKPEIKENKNYNNAKTITINVKDVLITINF